MLWREQLERALMGLDGPADVTKIDVEVIDASRFRWTIYSHGRKIFSAAGRREDLAGMAWSTEALIGMALGVRPPAVRSGASLN